MKFFSLLFLLSTQFVMAQSKYVDGKTYCKDVQKKESGKWLDVPKDYKTADGAKTGIYHWFLGNKYDAKKPTIIYVVGGPGATTHDYQSWHDRVSNLGFNVLFFDQRGYVCSRPKAKTDQADPKFYSVENTARDMEELRKSLGIKKWTVYGHSFGTPISYKYASLFPSSVTSLILEGPANLIPDKKEHDDAYKKRILEKTKNLLKNQMCIEKNNSEFENNIQVLSSVAGMAGARSYANLINSKYSHSKTFPSEEETDSLIESEYRKISKGAYVFKDAEKYMWEEENTELIVENDFPCSDLKSQSNERCPPNSAQMNKTFDARKLSVNVPTYFFLGEMDGTPVEQIEDVRKSMKSPNYFVEIKDAGHGTFQDIVDNGTEKSTNSMASIFKLAAEGKAIEEKNIKTMNSGSSFQLKLHP